MRVMIVEDDYRKCEMVVRVIEEVDPSVEISRSGSLANTVEQLSRTAYDLIVVDLMLPFSEGGVPVNTGEELLRLMEGSELNRHSQIVALTAYEELYKAQEELFTRVGVLLVHYEEVDDSWRKTLRSLIRRAFAHQRSEFVIICALEEERDGYTRTRACVGPYELENGFDVRTLRIGQRSGRLVLLPREGLITSGVVGAIAIERYRPKILAMSGICAGVRDRAELGQVLVCGNSWEYQVGKHSSQGFLSEPYQVPVPERLRMQLTSVCRSEQVFKLMYEGVDTDKIKPVMPKVANIVSGSAVVAHEGIRGQILRQHRKIDGVEMEIAALFRAGSLLSPSTMVIAAKTVVDFADEKKNDEVQQQGCWISARFVVEAIEQVMSEEGDS